MADELDFSKVDAAFQKVADTSAGRSSLGALASGLEQVEGVVPELNSAELHHLLVHLVNQREGSPAVEDPAFSDAKTAAGFKILTAVDVGPRLF